MNPMSDHFMNAMQVADLMQSALWAFALGSVLTVLVGGFLLQGLSFLVDRLEVRRRWNRARAFRSWRDRL